MSSFTRRQFVIAGEVVITPSEGLPGYTSSVSAIAEGAVLAWASDDGMQVGRLGQGEDAS